MNAKKWSWEKGKFEPYEVPKGATLYSADLNKEAECAACGKTTVFGDCYASVEIHSEPGYSYCVCEDCHNEESGRLSEKFSKVESQIVEGK